MAAHASSWWRSRSVAIATLLLLAVGVTGAITWEAARAVRAERSTAETVLREYASFGAAEYSRALRVQLADSLERRITMLASSESAVDEDSLAADVAPDTCKCGGQRIAVLTFFRTSRSRDWIVRGQPIPDALRTLIADDIPPPSIPHLHRGPQLRVAEANDRMLAVAWIDAHGRHTSTGTVQGIVAEVSALAPIFNAAAAGPLLPPSLITRAGNRQPLTLRVSAGDRQLFALGRWASPYVAEARTDQQNGSLTIAASLAPDVADALIIGGLPRSRLPLLYALIALVSGLIAIALVQMRRESELVRLREHFVAGVSHELRTPLAQIRMFAETLALGRVRTAEESRRSLGIIVRESQRLSHLVDNVLCFSRTTRAEFAARPEQVAIKQVLLDLIQTIEPLTRTRGVTFEVEAHESDCAMVDQGAFKQILLNLLDNAVKYGPDGQVVRITACKRGRTTQVTVDDQGPGIPADALQRIWQPFWRGPDSVQGGSGIGLSIVQQLAQAHEGRAYVERSNTGGARFVVELADRATNTSMPDLALQQSS